MHLVSFLVKSLPEAKDKFLSLNSVEFIFFAWTDIHCGEKCIDDIPLLYCEISYFANTIQNQPLIVKLLSVTKGQEKIESPSTI